MPRPKVSSAWIRRLPLGLPGVGVHLADDIGQPGMAGRPGRGWPAAPGVETGLRDHPAPGSKPAPAASLRPSLGWPRTVERGRLLVSSSAARRVTASSVSSCAIRRRAAASSSFSGLLRPGNRPRSIRSWRRQVEIDWALVPQPLGDLGDRPPGLNQVQDLAAELRRIAASSDAVLLSLASMPNPTNATPPNRGKTNQFCGFCGF